MQSRNILHHMQVDIGDNLMLITRVLCTYLQEALILEYIPLSVLAGADQVLNKVHHFQTARHIPILTVQIPLL